MLTAGCSGEMPAGMSGGGSSFSAVDLDSTEMIFLPETDAALLPLGIDAAMFAGSKMVVTPSSSYYGDGVKVGQDAFHDTQRRGNWSNLIVVDRKTGQGRLLLDRPALVSRVMWTRETQKPKYQLFVIIDRDTNHDGKLSTDDAATLWYATLPGGPLMQVTPADANLEEIVAEPKSEMLYLKYRFDTTGNGKYQDEDRFAWSRLDPAKPAMSTPLASEDLVEKARQLILKK